MEVGKLFAKIWDILNGESQPDIGTEEDQLLRRMERIAATEEPDYRQMWVRVQRKTTGRRLRRMNVRRVAVAVILLLSVAATAVYLYQEKTKMQPRQVVAEKHGHSSGQISLTLSDGRKVNIPRDTVGFVVKSGQVAVRQDSLSGIAYVSSGQDRQQLQYHTLEIPAEADYRLTLCDGTVVYLNSSSKLTYPVAFVGNERRVFLEGEGYFEVKSDAGHPFQVEVNGTIVEAVGTAFNINAYPEKDGVEATLVRGKVNVENGRQRVVLSPGQQARCDDRNIEVREVDCREYVSWKNGMFIFNRMTLEDIMLQMQRWYGLSVFFSSEAVKQYTFTGMIDKHLPAEETFRVIEKTVEVRFILKGKTVIIQ